jgi:hypothetical protein
VANDDPAYGREADPGALELLARMKALEGSEEPLRVRHREADAVVAHEERAIASPIGVALRRPQLRAPDLDQGALARGRELPRVAEEVLEDRAQEARVALDVQPLRDHELDRASRLSRRQLVGDRAREGAQIDRLAA